MVRPSSWCGCAFPERPLTSETASGRTMFAPTMWDSSWQTAPAPKFAPICAAYSTAPSRTFPSRAAPTQPITNPGPEQQPSTCKSAASRRVMRPAPYSCPASRAHTAYPPTQDSSSARAVSADSSPKTRCMGRSRAAGGGAAVSSSHTTKNGNSAGNALQAERRAPGKAPGRGLRHGQHKHPKRQRCRCCKPLPIFAVVHIAHLTAYTGLTSLVRGGNSHETEKAASPQAAGAP